MSWRTFVLGAAIILVANVFALFGVQRNRSGEPRQSISLTQRELELSNRREENSGISLRLRFNGQWEPDDARAGELGFSPNENASIRGRLSQRPVFVALECNGPRYAEWLEKQERQQPTAIEVVKQSWRTQFTRLFVADVARSPEPLLQKYANRENYLVVRGLATATVSYTDPVTFRRGPRRIEVFVSRIEPGSIHLPLPLSQLDTAHPYIVDLSYGPRFEPWATAIRKGAE